MIAASLNSLGRSGAGARSLKRGVGVVPLVFGLVAVCSAGEFDIDLPQIQELSPAPGTVVSPENLEQFKGVIDADIAELIAQGWLTIDVGEPMSFDPHPAYVAATTQYGGQAQLGDKPGQLLNYTAGRPFPGDPVQDDPREGEKLAWNMRYAFSADSATIPEMYWQYRDMRSQEIERVLEFTASSMRFMYRHTTDPKPSLPDNPYQVFSAITLTALDPGDVANTKLLIFYNSDDAQEEQGWMYVPLLRRVRRVATTARTDSFLGSDIMIEDFLGYSGRIRDMTWSYSGTTYVLLPMYRYDQTEHSTQKARDYDYNFVDFHGHSGCFPQVTWQLRKAYIVEGKPVRDGHPLSRRLFYVDAQTSLPIMGKLYDRAGTLWKILIGGVAHPDYHLPENKGSGVPVLDSSAAIDIQSKHCTTLQMVTVMNSPKVKAKEFEPSDLNVGAR